MVLEGKLIPPIEEHCKDCRRILGIPFKHVHKWLDEKAPEYNYSSAHRRERHNRYGI